ncbi:MAG: DNA helicase RecQ [Actinomycetota bacterium]
MTSSASEVLGSVFGYPEFRGDQAAIVDQLIAGRDCLVLMPTGGGKSLCYQVPALVREGTAIVVSPLIALMQDQVAAMSLLGVRAAFLNSTLDARTARETEEALLASGLDLLYVAPERLLTNRFMSLLVRTRLALFAIDEAHCVSMWGHDFRPEYRELRVLHERFPDVPRIALTATADVPTRADIVEHLALHDARTFVASFDRPNIRYRVEQKKTPHQQLLVFLESRRGDAGIVYRLSRRKVEETAEFLCEHGWPAVPYHAGLDATTRRRHQNRFVREDGVVVVATVAFGMGIDKPDVRFVVHLDLPRSLEGYYQETGRAGRDGLGSEALLTYGMADIGAMQQFIESSQGTEERKRVERQKLFELLAYCESAACRRQALLAHFGEEHPGSCGNCDNCIDPPKTWDGTVAAQKALSCVYRTEERFGASHLIDVLLGKVTEKIERFGHQSVSTFGIGTELAESQWRAVFRQLIALGLLAPDPLRHGGLRLTEASRPVLRGERTVTFREDVRARKVKRKIETRGFGDIDPRDATLWEALRLKRSELAKAQDVPPYVIFHDKTLREIVSKRPRTLDEFASIGGVGARKLELYGPAFLDVVADDS